MSGCGCCGPVSRKVIYKCSDRECPTIKEFDREPKQAPTCCGKPMKKA